MFWICYGYRVDRISAALFQRISLLAMWACKQRALLAVFLWGAALRILYFAATPFYERTYDTEGHIAYIIHVVRNFSIPATTQGWEMHQPPLYYFLAGVWVKAGLMLGRTTEELSFDVRTLSLLLSFMTLAVIVWIGSMLFAAERDRLLAIIFGLIIGTLPGIAMAATRINNDVLSFLLSFLWFAFALRWWTRLHSRDFWATCILLGLGMLTKFTTGALALPMAIFIILHPRIATGRKLLLFTQFILLLTVLSGWYFAFRSWEYLHMLFVPGASGLNARLVMANRALDFAMFNPMAIIYMPFTSPWDTFPDRRYIWEYVFRSGFFGEWMFMHLLWLGRTTVAVALAGIVACVMGVIRTARTWEYARPMLILLISLLATIAVFRGLHPCACAQDFRFIPLIAIPVVSWAVLGWTTLENRRRMWTCAWALGLAALQSAFLLSFFVM